MMQMLTDAERKKQPDSLPTPEEALEMIIEMKALLDAHLDEWDDIDLIAELLNVFLTHGVPLTAVREKNGSPPSSGSRHSDSEPVR